jgi:hypothetical protein
MSGKILAKDRVVIVTGGMTHTEDLSIIRPDDVVIGVDGGLSVCGRDFYTAGESFLRRLCESGIPTRRLHAEKDWTDSQFAIEQV